MGARNVTGGRLAKAGRAALTRIQAANGTQFATKQRLRTTDGLRHQAPWAWDTGTVRVFEAGQRSSCANTLTFKSCRATRTPPSAERRACTPRTRAGAYLTMTLPRRRHYGCAVRQRPVCRGVPAMHAPAGLDASGPMPSWRPPAPTLSLRARDHPGYRVPSGNTCDVMLRQATRRCARVRSARPCAPLLRCSAGSSACFAMRH